MFAFLKKEEKKRGGGERERNETQREFAEKPWLEMHTSEEGERHSSGQAGTWNFSDGNERADELSLCLLPLARFVTRDAYTHVCMHARQLHRARARDSDDISFARARAYVPVRTSSFRVCERTITRGPALSANLSLTGDLSVAAVFSV